MIRILFLIASLFFTVNSYSLTYSSAVTAGDFVYVSAQSPVDPMTGQMVEGDIGMLTNLVIDHLQHELLIKGVALSKVIKTEVFLKDIRDYEGMDAAYGARFNFQYPPARDVVEVSNLLNNARIEISCIAYKKRN